MSETPSQAPGERRDPSQGAETVRAGEMPIGEDISPITGLLLASVLVILIQALLIAHGRPALLGGELWDPDAYMWLERVRRLWNGAGWFDHLYPRIDPPTGFVSHWTRPMDAVLLAGGWALTPVLGFERALFWWGAATGPLLFLATASAALWAAKPTISRSGLWLLPLILVTQPSIIASFAVGRPDHQSLLAVLFTLLLGAALRMAVAPGRLAPPVIAALVASLALWTSVQILPMIAALGIGLTVAWIAGRPGLARAFIVLLAVLCLGLTAALFAQYGNEAFAARPGDTLSPSHLALFSLLLLFWIGAAALRRSAAWQRAVYTVLAGAGVGALLWFLAPEFFTQPVGPIDPLYRAVHLSRIRELQPAFAAPLGAGWQGQAAILIERLGIALPAILFLLLQIVRRRGGERCVWSVLATTAAVYLPLAVLQLRWANFAILTVLIPYAGFVYATLKVLTKAARRYHWSQAVRPAIAAAACLWIFIPGLLVGSQGVISREKTVAGDRCPRREVAAFLAAQDGFGSEPTTIVTLSDFGPELLYRTPHSVLSIPNHRPQPGFTLTYRIMSESDPDMALALLRERGIGLVLICVGSVEAEIYRPTGAQPSLYQRLAAGAPPEGLAPIAIPQNRGGAFRLFEVRPSED